jgi:hypothetical protein
MLTARLDNKTGLRVLCGRQTCRGHIGDISQGTRLRSPSEITSRMFLFVVGYHKRPDGFWELPPRVKKRIAHGQLALNRHRHRLGTSRSEDGEFKAEYGHQSLAMPTTFPAVAVCPVCGEENALIPENLRLIGWPLQGSLQHPVDRSTPTC